MNVKQVETPGTDNALPKFGHAGNERVWSTSGERRMGVRLAFVFFLS